MAWKCLNMAAYCWQQNGTHPHNPFPRVNHGMPSAFMKRLGIESWYKNTISYKVVLWVVFCTTVVPRLAYFTTAPIIFIVHGARWMVYSLFSRIVYLSNICTRGYTCNYSSLQTIFRSKQIHRNNRIRLYKTLIKPVLCYWSVTWTLTQTTEKMLKTFERKILRRI